MGVPQDVVAIQPMEEIYNQMLDVLEDRDEFLNMHIQIPVIIGILGNMQQNEFNKNLSETGLTVSQFQVLLYLFRHSKEGREITSRELEAQFRVTNPTMAGILKRLENKGYIYRTPGKTDKRNKQIHLNMDSRFLESEVESKVKELQNRFRRFYQGFTKEETEQLRLLLRRLLENVEQYPDENE